MFYFHACPHCKDGALEVCKDYYSEYLRCVVCGYSKDVKVNIEAPQDKSVMEQLPSKAHVGVRAGHHNIVQYGSPDKEGWRKGGRRRTITVAQDGTIRKQGWRKMR